MASLVGGIATGVGLGFVVNSLTGYTSWLFPILGAVVGMVGGMMFFGGVIGTFVKRRYFGVDEWSDLR